MADEIIRLEKMIAWLVDRLGSYGCPNCKNLGEGVKCRTYEARFDCWKYAAAKECSE